MDKIIAKRIFWTIYVVFLLTSYIARHIFGLIFGGPVIIVIYGLIALTSFIPYRIAMNHFEKSIINPDKSLHHKRIAWTAFACSFPLKLILIAFNYSEIIDPTSNHWNFG